MFLQAPEELIINFCMVQQKPFGVFDGHFFFFTEPVTTSPIPDCLIKCLINTERLQFRKAVSKTNPAFIDQGNAHADGFTYTLVQIRFFINSFRQAGERLTQRRV